MLFSICSPHALVPVEDLTNYMVVLRGNGLYNGYIILVAITVQWAKK